MACFCAAFAVAYENIELNGYDAVLEPIWMKFVLPRYSLIALAHPASGSRFPSITFLNLSHSN
jgi:hypothetical protein